LSPGAVHLLTLAAGVALAEGIVRSTGLAVEIKWPNDVMTAETSTPRGRQKARKLGGILAEAHGTMLPLTFVILGFGINLRTAAYPPDIAARATSIEAELGRAPDSGLVLIECLAALAQAYGSLTRGENESIRRRWEVLAPTSRGANVAWTDGSVVRHGITAGIDPEGALLVRSTEGRQRVVAGPIEWL
jgi:BirA family biotin operon repressor/biotin-[acetyl-CoA-carboxylase] ligase